jgi:predicted O-linked N-acetylglucosamine transferase (SPINDLY family)
MPLLSSHDHKQFEIVCYADAPHPDAITQRIQGYADKWCNTARMSDQQIADRISADQIDILVDLTMHMDGGRPFLFARKPAPVQMAWLAYPSTTGLTSMDYRLTDPWLDPPVMNDGFYTEQSIRLPETFWCYDPLTMEPSVNALPADSAGRITFGCLNTFCKVNESTLGMWSEVLRALPDSHLILLAPKGASRQRVIQILGIDASRVQFFDRHPRRTYLEWYHQIDIGLDTFPTNGHTTSLDAMWMGVPVVTRAGRTAISRGGLSLLSNIGLTELVATNADEFIRIAVALANDLPRLRELRGTLRDRMSKSVLMDAPRFAHHVEAAYRTMWRRWCESGDIPKPG